MSDTIHSRPLSEIGRENYDRIFRSGRFSLSFEPGPDCGEFGTVIELNGTVRPAGRPLSEIDPAHSLVPGTVREYRSDCCWVSVSSLATHYVCSKCGKPCTVTLTKVNS